MRDKTFTEKLLLVIAVEFAVVLFFIIVAFLTAP